MEGLWDGEWGVAGAPLVCEVSGWYYFFKYIGTRMQNFLYYISTWMVLDMARQMHLFGLMSNSTQL